jgi:hypothetical protein
VRLWVLERLPARRRAARKNDRRPDWEAPESLDIAVSVDGELRYEDEVPLRYRVSTFQEVECDGDGVGQSETASATIQVPSVPLD